MIRSKFRISVLFLLLAFFLITVPMYLASVRVSGGLQPYWSSADAWMRSAECARTTGVILAQCRDGQLVPFANGSPGDDPGHALVLGIYAAITHNAPLLTDISIINSTVNYAGIAVLAVLLVCLRLPLASFLVLTIGPLVSDEFQMLGPHPAQFGAACFAAVLPLAILGLPIVSANRRSLCIWIVVGILGLSMATLLRQAIGLMGVVAGCGAVAANLLIHRPNRPGAVAGVALITAILVSYQTPFLVSLARNTVYHLPPADLLEQHGIWHNLYIGLGAVDNPFGIVWDDADAVKAAKQADPTATYGSVRYFAALRKEYFLILRQRPIEVAGVYLRKLDAVFETEFPPPFEKLKLWHAFVVLLVAGICVRGLLFYRRSGLYAADAVVAVGLLFTAFFIAQGVLFHYRMLYLFPVHLFLLLCAGAIAEFLLSRLTNQVPTAPLATRIEQFRPLAESSVNNR